MNRNRILIVDDDENLLASFRRVLASRFEVDTATGGEAGLAKLDAEPLPAIIISDYKMPGMNGVEFLSQAAKKAPDSARMLLTGYADLETALKAVNEGAIFRLLTKPCPPPVMVKALMDGVEHYELAASRRELMEKTIEGGIGILADLISIVHPDVYGRISRILPYVRRTAEALNPAKIWECVTAARLSMIGFLTLHKSIIEKDLVGAPLSRREQELFYEHPVFAAKYIGKIPRLEEVSRIIRYQEKRWDGSGSPDDELRGAEIPLGARILKATLDFDRASASGMHPGEALNHMASHGDWYDPDVMTVYFDMLGDQPKLSEKRVFLNGLVPGMIVMEDVLGTKGAEKIKLLAKGQELSEMVIEYLIKHAHSYKIPEPIMVNSG